MKMIIAVLVLCAGTYAQSVEDIDVDSLIVGFVIPLDIYLMSDSIVYVPDTNYVSISELLESLELALSYMEEKPITTLLYISPAQALRNEADRIEQKEKDLIWVQSLLSKAKKYYGDNP